MEKRLTIPVVFAALLSIPAVYLGTLGSPWPVVGTVLNWVSATVLVGETLLMLWLSGSVPDWFRRYRWHLLVAGLTVPAVIFVVGPAQILRLVLVYLKFRMFRAGRIVGAGRAVTSKFRLEGRQRRLVFTVLVVLAAGFLTIELSDPESRSRRAISWLHEHIGLWWTVLALLGLLALVEGVPALVRYLAGRSAETGDADDQAA